ncbi:hypothetical protein A8C56_05780 [Niabella ginsenosidivorans]|uniref:Uncharacterized protein n=1 Tax=Niabella ginsenosidivorans TaxID=1176587 RepID=A0A1A9HZ72_9BACT|nr:hypothetical protein [Niabella ginsenosidivorans]ANH80563.1 hypothetical protein A8C56_05780 [Niabella ginsenosidivorans]
MNKNAILKIAMWIALPLTCVAVLSFTFLPQRARSGNLLIHQKKDTIPPVTEFETGRLDEALKYLDERMKDFNNEWANKTGRHIQQQVTDAIAKIDFSKAQLAAMEAIKKTDWDKINRDIENATAGISKAEIDRKIAKAMALVKPVDKEKIRSQVEEAIRNVNLQVLKIQMDEARKKLQKQQLDMDQHLKSILPGINDQLLKTKEQLQRLKDASLQMQRDGLIDSNSGNKIQFIKGKLFINGVQQPDKVSDKYRHYFIDRKGCSREQSTIVAV